MSEPLMTSPMANKKKRLAEAEPPTGLRVDPVRPAPSGSVALDGYDAQAILEAFKDGVILLDARARLLAWNESAKAIMAAARRGQHVSIALRYPALLEAIDHVVAGGDAMEIDFEQPGALEREWAARISPIRNDGAGAAVLINLQDVTLIRNAERTRTDFIAHASHELRTPLASLTGFIETLRGHARNDQEAREKFLSIMHEQAERMGALINDLLSLSRIEQFEFIAPSDPVDLVDVVTDVAEQLSPMARQRDLTIEIDNQAGRAEILGDRDQLVQVALNLIENALKYAAPGKPIAIEIGRASGRDQAADACGRRWPDAGRYAILTPQVSARTRYVWLRVANEGEGIERSYLPRLAERFFRVEKTTKQRSNGEGTGLGLAIVKHVVNRHRGGFIVESVHGQNAAFSVYIPELTGQPGKS